MNGRLSKLTLLFLFLLLFLWQGVEAQNAFLDFVPDSKALGFGGSIVAWVSDPSAIYWNPAAMTRIKESSVLLCMNKPFGFNFVGFTNFYPPNGAFGCAFSQILKDLHSLEVGTVAWGQRFSPGIALGVNVNFFKDNQEFYSTWGFSFLFEPKAKTSRKQQLSNWPLSFLNIPVVANKLALGMTLHNLPFRANNINYGLKLGLGYRPTSWGPTIHSGYHIRRGKKSFHIGASWQPVKALSLYSGIEDFDKKKATFGAGLVVKNFTCAFTYSVFDKKIFSSYSVTLGDRPRLSAKKHFERGTERVKNKDYRGALKEFEKSLAYDPTNQKAVQLVNYLDKIVQAEKRKIDSLFTEAVNFQKKGWYISATLNYLKILDLAPNHKKAQHYINRIKPRLDIYIQWLYNVGVNYFQNAEYSKAKTIFNEILLVKKEHATSKMYLAKIDSICSARAEEHFLRGLGYYKQRNLQKAQEEFVFSLANKPSHQEAKDYLRKVQTEIFKNKEKVKRLLQEGETLEKRKLYLKANQKYLEVLNLDRNNTIATQRLEKIRPFVDSFINRKYQEGKRLFDQNEFNKARKAFGTVLSVAPNHRMARKYLNRIRKLVSQQSAEHYNLGLEYFQAQKWEKAVEEFEKVLSIEPKHKGASTKRKEALSKMGLVKLLRTGKSYFREKNYLKALEIFEQVLETEPNNLEALQYIEICQRRLRELVEEHFNRGITFYTEENYEAAIQEWNKVLKLDPNHSGATEYIRRAEERLRALEELP